ncbi:MAG TPA: hypothetical protein VEY09_19075 [Pyrinomonadaceae bacterium]|nr:hypothetical protein [Pyrinomonadaceae bacterium]
MRWKLLIIASLAAALVGAGAAWAVARLAADPSGAGGTGGAVLAASLIAPVAAITFASIFVYRHTARRRSVQAMATALLATALTLAALLAGSLVGREWPVEAAPIHSPTAGNS